MTERVDKLEKDVKKAVRLGYATLFVSLLTLLIRLLLPAAPASAPPNQSGLVPASEP